MFATLPDTAEAVADWTWRNYRPYFEALALRELTQHTLADWMADFDRLVRLIAESFIAASIAQSVDTTDKAAQKRMMRLMTRVMPFALLGGLGLLKRLHQSGLDPLPDMEIASRAVHSTIETFSVANLPNLLLGKQLGDRYDHIMGAQTIDWQGEERTVKQMMAIMEQSDRATREAIFRQITARREQDKAALDALWVRLLALRQRMAANVAATGGRTFGLDRLAMSGTPGPLTLGAVGLVAGAAWVGAQLNPRQADYRALVWRDKQRFDYTPADCKAFHAAIEAEVVPAVRRLNADRRERLGVDVLRPWDLPVNPYAPEPLRPFQQVSDLIATTSAMFYNLDPQLGGFFDVMAQRGLLDLDNRKGKAPGGYNTALPAQRLPFIFMNAVGTHDDVQTLLHEGGHAFHVFESGHLPYIFQQIPTAEFAEVASMAMELLALPYLDEERGGFYTSEDAARAELEHFDKMLRVWPHIAMVDAFQHWVYENPQDAANPDRCDAQWRALHERFIPDVDYSGSEAAISQRWRHQLHIYQVPFYYIEYGLAQLGAVQIWMKAQRDQAAAVADYRQALSLGSTRTIPALYEAAGARLAFDRETLHQAVAAIEARMTELKRQLD